MLLIGWDAADWKFLNPLIDQGLMPTLQKLVEGGAMGRLATLDPPLSPTLWTSIATGKRPYDHGIHGFTEPDPNGEGIRPIYSTSRKVKAIWNILNQKGLKTHVVGWWPSHPAEPISGVMVSNFYQRPHKDLSKAWPLKEGTVHPPEKAELFAKLRVHPSELTAAHILPFIPNLDKINQYQDKRPLVAAGILSDCSSIHSAATYILENEEWDFMAVYYDAIDHFCHGFMKYHPPYRDHLSREDYENYKEVVNAACRFHDMMLERLLDLAGPDTTVMLISDHGFHPDHNRPKSLPNEPAAPALEHSPYGIIVMNGPGINNDSSIFGASLLDIAPTILHLYDLPVANDMEGKVLMQAFSKTTAIRYVDSWEQIEGDDGSHPPEAYIDGEEAKQELQQLIELGYVEDLGDNVELAIKKTVDENNYNLARSYIHAGRWKESLPYLERLNSENPSTVRYAVRLIKVYQQLGKYRQARKTLDSIKQLSKAETPQMDVVEGMLLLAENRPQKAISLFKKAQKEAGNMPNLNNRIANGYLELNKLDLAKEAILDALKEDPESESSYLTLGVIYYNQLDYENALNAFLDAVGLLYYMPLAHYYIGLCLLKLDRPENAISALEVSLKLAPGFNKARNELIHIYENVLKQPGKSNKYKKDLNEKVKGTITVVSGLPRSGTSMMMQMLDKGGMDIFTDLERSADENNPKGYYEHQSVKSLKSNKSFLDAAKNKVVKVIAQLLPYLSMKYRYKIIFMERDLMEVISSQQKMLQRIGKTNTDTLPLGLLQEYENTLTEVKHWAEQHPLVDILFVSHREVIQAPLLASVKVNEFLGNQYDPELMCSAVDAKLYRERSN